MQDEKALDRAGKKSVPVYLAIATVIAAVIVAVLCVVGPFVSVPFLSLFPFVLLAVALVIDRTGEKPVRSSVVIAAVIAAVIVDLIIAINAVDVDFWVDLIILAVALPPSVWSCLRWG